MALKIIYRALLLVVFAMPAYGQKGQFLTVQEYQNRIFGEQLSWQMLWISKDSREALSEILGRRFAGLRVRYWGQGQRTGWVFEEIGKELPITVGVTVEQSQIVDISILEYRESRGGEVRYPFFTDQFKGVTLRNDDDHRLDRKIDGITGATLSVNALKKIAQMALYCHDLTPFGQQQSSTTTDERAS